MFKATKEGDPGWEAPSKSVLLTRHIRYALKLNPFIGGTPIEPTMSATTFIMRMPEMHERYVRDVLEFFKGK